jgi:hypothetical protein
MERGRASSMDRHKPLSTALFVGRGGRRPG